MLLPSQQAASPRGRNETVLVAEDEECVRKLLRSTLEDNGYTVLEAAHGKEALEVVRACAQPIDLLLTDVIMPEMGGRILAEQFTTLYPEAKVLFISGYLDDAVVHQGVLEAEVNFIQKPFAMAHLLRKIRAVLDHNEAGNGTPTVQEPVGESIPSPQPLSPAAGERGRGEGVECCAGRAS